MMSGSMHTSSASLTTGEFAEVARAISDATRRLGLVAPGFRSPSRVVGVDRTLRRFAGEEVAGVVAVNLRDRPMAAVLADMIEGVVALNRLSALDATRVRAALWSALDTTASSTAAASVSRSAHVA